MKYKSIIGITTGLFLMFLAGAIGQNTKSTVKKENVYEWRGENRKGIYPDVNLLKSWPAEGPQVVWEYMGVGNGYGSPVFTNDKMYIQGEVDSLAYLFA
ncbi:MAG: hypothetical protein PHY99_04720, partial [Bacteroidales bacterium]|nr:hypothetical protein [Bacteroidales bacterium]